MAGPWDKYQTQADAPGPWTKYQAAPDEPATPDKPEPSTSLPGIAASIGRGAAPIAAGAGVGAMLGGPPGAAVGAGAMGLTEMALGIYNPIADKLGLPQAITPQEATDKLLDLVGIRRPSTGLERGAEAAAGAASGAGGMARGAEEVAASAAGPLVKGIAGKLAERPAAQVVGGATSGFAAQGAAEAGAGPLGQTVAGMVGGLVPGAAGKVAGIPKGTPPSDPFVDFVSAIKGEDISKNEGAMRIVKRMRQDAKAGGPTAQDMMDLLNTTPAKPLTAADVGGANVLAQAGRVERTPGESRQIINKFLDTRQAGQYPRMDADIVRALGSEGGDDAFKALVKARSTAAKPLFEAAYEGGSVSPLEKQFENAFNEASKAEAVASKDVNSALSSLTAAKAKQPVTGGNVYSDNAANQAVREAEQRVAVARQKLADTQNQKQQILDMLHEAQDDIANDKPGAVWNPRIQQFLDNPRIQQGIKRGLRIERDEALAEGRKMNPSDYAIVGIDDAGEPIVGKVPTMRLLAVAKEGLDRMLQGDEFRNPLTGELNKEGVAIDKMRAAYLRELDTVNPRYAAARAQWGGDSQALEAMKLGQKIFNTHERDLAAKVAEMSPDAKEYFKLGAARALHDAIAAKGFTADESKAILRAPATKERIRQAFGSDDEFERYIQSVEAEGRMFGTAYKIRGGSPSASRLAEDATPELDAFASAARGVHHAVTGNWFSSASHLREALAQYASRRDPATNAEIARLLTADLSDPAVQARMRALKDSLDATETSRALYTPPNRSIPLLPLVTGPFSTVSPVDAMPRNQ